jgi:hypothetical protein
MTIGTNLLSAVLFVCVAATAQESNMSAAPASKTRTLSSGTFTFPNGIRVDNQIVGNISAFSDPKGPRIGFGELGTWDGPVFHHFFFIDQRYFGYDLKAEPVPGTDRIRLKFEPLTVDWTGEGIKLAAPEPTFPPPQVVGEGEEIVMDLAFNTADGQKITEHLSAQIGLRKPPVEPRDLTLDEVDLHLSLPTLFVDDQIVGQSKLSYAAPMFAIHVPESGWIYLSTRPHDGYNFERAGVIHASRAEFTVGGHHYEVRSRSIIGPRREINLYVLLDQREPASLGGVRFTLAPNAKLPKDYLELRAGAVKQMLPRP